jgi:hypothetical protein
LFLPLFFFFKNSPKIACQAPEPSNKRAINNIHMKKVSLKTAIIETEERKAESPIQKVWFFFFKGKEMKTLQRRGIDCKDFSTAEPGKSKSKSPAMKTLRTFYRVGGDPFLA